MGRPSAAAHDRTTARRLGRRVTPAARNAAVHPHGVAGDVVGARGLRMTSNRRVGRPPPRMSDRSRPCTQPQRVRVTPLFEH